MRKNERTKEKKKERDDDVLGWMEIACQIFGCIDTKRFSEIAKYPRRIVFKLEVIF